MGFLNALINSAGRFRDEVSPPGFGKGKITWALDLDLKNPAVSQLVRIDVDDAFVPDKPPDRTSSRVSAKLFTDKAEYALATNGKRETHRAFIALARKAEDHLPDLLDGVTTALEQLPNAIRSTPKPSDQVAVRLRGQRLTDNAKVAAFWVDVLKQKSGAAAGTCSACGEEKPVQRLFPGDITLFSERGVKLMSVDTESDDKLARDSRGLPQKITSAFSSRGCLQLRNSPICLDCASLAVQLCRCLIQGHHRSATGRNFSVLARDDSPSRSQPLRNQLAVFWTRAAPEPPPPVDSADEDCPLTGPESEAATRLVLKPQDAPDDGPPPEDGQMRDLLRKPWSGGKAATSLQTNAFYFAVLSPNKTRLVIREWMQLGVEEIRTNLAGYISATRIIHPELGFVWFPPLPALLDALQPPKADTSSGEGRRANDPHLLRDLLRCAFRGETPPMALLAQAVQRFAVPDREKEDRKNVLLRRMNLAAAMKLCLTHKLAPEEQHAMEQLDERRRKPAYLCGRLLAVLDEVQRQYHRPNTVNTTLADRFYGTASTAPASVFANLMNIATKAHLPKLRREGREFIAAKVEEVCAELDESGGFPPPLAPKDQAEFGLGFYHQRAKFAADRRQARLEAERKRAAAAANSTDPEGSVAS